jgi:hypothetical protein
MEKPMYLIPESVYHFDHPEVVRWTAYFTKRAGQMGVFDKYYELLFEKPVQMEAAQKIAAVWYDFTCFVPTFLSKAVTLTQDPEWQHHLIQIAYEELGGRYKKNIHSTMYIEAIHRIGLRIDPKGHTEVQSTLDILDSALEKTRSQQGILGLLLSFEIIALENIEALFNGLSYEEEHATSLSKSRFFLVHRKDEAEHIRHSIANFIRFCVTDQDRSDFIESFDAGIDYWKTFWDMVSNLAFRESAALKQEALIEV